MQIKNKFDKITQNKILKGALIAGSGAFIVIMLEAVMQLDFGDWTPIVVAMCSIIINAVREYNKGV
jgi:hypothetical protein